jgi:hypothetical protein
MPAISTIENYLSSLSFYQKLREMDYSNCNNFFAKTMLKGSKNLELNDSITKNC